MNEEEIQTAIEKYFESIDFLPIGEKIAKLGEALSIAKKLRHRKAVEIPTDLSFLGDLMLEDLIDTMRAFQHNQKFEVKKLEEMRAVFRTFNARITNGQLKSIPYPNGIDMKFKSDENNNNLILFTSAQMRKWFNENVQYKRYPFKIPSTSSPIDDDLTAFIEVDIINFCAFGLALYHIENDAIYLDAVQPLSFFEGTYSTVARHGKGISQPLKKAHLLMLFFVLKMAAEKGIKRIIEKRDTRLRGGERQSPTEREVYREIDSIATTVTEVKNQNGKVIHVTATFQK